MSRMCRCMIAGKEILNRHLFFLLMALLWSYFLLCVPQVQYAFVSLWPMGWGTLVAQAIPVTVLLLYHMLALFVLLDTRLTHPPFGQSRFGLYIKKMVARPALVARIEPTSRRFTAALVLSCLGSLALIMYLLAPADLGEAPLSELALINAGWLLLLLALWSFLTLWPYGLKWFAPTRDAVDCLIGWLIVTYAVGEAIWLAGGTYCPGSLCHSPWYLMYTRWALLELLFLSLNIACVIDQLEYHWKAPFRILACAGLGACLALSLATEPVKEQSRPLTSDANDSSRMVATGSLLTSSWAEHLRARLEKIPAGPVVLVAASGGGSRAALFASLVLEGMAREESLGKHKFSEHVLMISGVSGGSLASAYFLAGNGTPTEETTTCEPSDCLDVLARIDKILHEEPEFQLAVETEAGGDVEMGRRRAVEHAKSVIDRLRQEDRGADNVREAWILSNRFVGDMGGDFMAPILRGALVPGIDRGAALERFWERHFRWAGIDNQGRVAQDSKASWPGVPPLAFFNASNTSWGTRFVLDFPLLPPSFFSHDAMEVTASRFPVRAVSDLPDPPIVTLAQAVRLSSNFPWGFSVRKLRNVHLSDGGVVDNTGIDTLYEVFRRLNTLQGGKELLCDIARRGVVLLEIDAGNKPSGQYAMSPQTAGLLEPLTALNAAAHTNADTVKKFYLQEINRILSAAVSESLFAEARTLQTESAQLAIKTLQEHFPRVLIHYLFQCEHFQTPAGLNGTRATSAAAQQRSVMTAWALDRNQQARVLTRFLVELSTWEAELEQQRSELIKVLTRLGEIQDQITKLATVERIKPLLAKVEKLASRAVPLRPESRRKYAADIDRAVEELVSFRQQLQTETQIPTEFLLRLDRIIEQSKTHKPMFEVRGSIPKAFKTFQRQGPIRVEAAVPLKNQAVQEIDSLKIEQEAMEKNLKQVAEQARGDAARLDRLQDRFDQKALLTEKMSR